MIQLRSLPIARYRGVTTRRTMESMGSTTSASPVRLDLLGGFRLSVEAEDVPLPMNAQRLVCFLALHDQPLLRTFVGGSLWGESSDSHAGGSLRSPPSGG